MTTNNTQIKIGDPVKIKQNAPGTMWDHGYVMDIDAGGILIKYGEPGVFECYGTVNDVELISGE